MSISSLCKRGVVTIHRDATVEDAALFMRSSHIGDVVVVDAADTRRPVGIITDRDIAVEVVAQGLARARTRAGRRNAQDREFLQRRVRELKVRRCTRTFWSRWTAAKPPPQGSGR